MVELASKMKLQSIAINNYRSIEEIHFPLSEIEQSYTYSLIGINESGKSSFLKAISLIGGIESISFPQDFHDDLYPITINFEYNLAEEELLLLQEELLGKNFPADLFEEVSIQSVTVKAIIQPNTSVSLEKKVDFALNKNIYNSHTLSESTVMIKAGAPEEEDLDLKRYLEENLLNFILTKFHSIVFWKSDPRFLITDPINLDSFSADPENFSIPLKNCFELAGITDIPTEISKIKTNPAEKNNLQERLGDIVTEHIKKIWPGHPIEIKFQIDDTSVTFLVEDEGVKYKTKTTAQRSDGFKQFVSFLLSVSAQNSNSQLTNTILLLDEPETHMHPQGQENLRDELINISKSKLNNIVIFATHSNFMIDKSHLERSYRVHKKGNEKTQVSSIDGGSASYSETNYIVFDIPTTDYHNELYGFLERESREKLDDLPKEKNWINEKKGATEKVSLPTYIRHSIHHPENTKNKMYTQAELKRSIDTLRGLR